MTKDERERIKVVAAVRDEIAVIMYRHGIANGNYPVVLPAQMRGWAEALSGVLAAAKAEQATRGEASGG